MQQRVVIIGCGVVGAAIAYELSLAKIFDITVLDQQPPAQASTGAALGVLMGIISQKIKGKAWQLRETSIRRYHRLIPELEAATGRTIAHNPHGLVKLCRVGEDWQRWQDLQLVRRSQGWTLDLWDCQMLGDRCPQLNTDQVLGAIHSPQDLQVSPTDLTLALVAAAAQNGVTFQFDAKVQQIEPELHRVKVVSPSATVELTADWIIVSAGLGSTPLTASLAHPVKLVPVLGQALRLNCGTTIGDPTFQPAITGDDIHIVPLANHQYWVGATVEFPGECTEVDGVAIAAPERLDRLLAGAIALCPGLAEAEISDRWSGLRPRPVQRPAPIIEPLPGFAQVLLATGHYRNGVLLAPATALQVKQFLS
jgi:glycine/D-amino acid oxidase-like deaminating enzyme